MLMIKTDKATVEIEPGAYFFLKRGEDPDDSIRIEWNDLDETAVANLNQFVTMIEGSLEGMTQS
ncbi:MAG: hypothetical protein JXQ81_11325 [Desulfuromonadales bacterium]|nr:hypothetical protein [Desulfuromonadales bacterium]MBN2793089.1 hypothetical protein [Desulfuromonadales bacterium]